MGQNKMSAIRLAYAGLILASLSVPASADCTLKQLEGRWKCNNGPQFCTPNHDISRIVIQNDGSYRYFDGNNHEAIASISGLVFTARFIDNATIYTASVDSSCQLMTFQGGQVAYKM